MLSALLQSGALLLLLWLVANTLLLAVYRRRLGALWREPVFKVPILVIESDDWGAGPLSQAAALWDIATVLERHRDGSGRAPILNLALVLAVPDGPAIQAVGAYRRVCLDDPRLRPVLEALLDGQARGVFALQLHGMEHYWPATLMSSGDATIQQWLRQVAPAATEQLPSHLQSRWVDAAALPSTPHLGDEVRAAVKEEVQAYTRIIGQAPKVVVPPTFVWTREVEVAWAAEGIECVVTPGWRYTRRSERGLPDGDEGPIVNGDTSGGIGYLARVDYFEPARGRDALHALRVLDRAASEGRPALLENHRDNFINDAPACNQSLGELDKLCREATVRHGDLRFLSSRELCRVLRDRDPKWLALRLSERIPVVMARLRNSGRLWRLMALSGLGAVCSLASQRAAGAATFER